MTRRVEHFTETMRIRIEPCEGGFQAIGQDLLLDEVSVIRQHLGGPFKTERLAARFALVLTDPIMMVLYLTGGLPGYFNESPESN